MSVRRRSRRAFFRRAILAGAGGLLAACGGSNQTLRTVMPISSEDERPLGAALDLTRSLSGRIAVAYADELGKKPPYIEETARAVEQAYPNATVVVERYQLGGSEFYDALLPSLHAGAAADVLHIAGDRLGELADAGYIAPLDEYVKNWPDWRYYSPTVRESVTYQGQVWAIPYGLDTRFLYYRRDVFDQVGLPSLWQPKNVADILSAAAQVQARRRDVIPYALYAGPTGGSGTANHGFVPLLYAYGGSLKDGRGNWIGDSPAIRKAFAFYATAYRGERLVPASLLSTPRSWVEMRDALGAGRLAILFEGGWVYGGWASKDRAVAEKNIGYLLFPTESEGPSFTIGGAGTCWFIAAASPAKDLAWEFISRWNSRDTVGRLNAEDPHPVARVDAVRVPEYRADRFLVDSTESLRRAYFIPPDAAYGRVSTAIQTATAAVASGEIGPNEAAARFAADLREAIGPNRVVVQA